MCNLLKARGRYPSIDIAKVNRDVPIVPDSSAPIIEIIAPTPTIRLPIHAAAGEKLRIFEAASTNGACELINVDCGTAPITTKLVSM